MFLAFFPSPGLWEFFWSFIGSLYLFLSLSLYQLRGFKILVVKLIKDL